MNQSQTELSRYLLRITIGIFLLSSCGAAEVDNGQASQGGQGGAGGEGQPVADVPTSAEVKGVRVSGASGSYTFSVTLRSPDTGCAQYADWWEVLDASGALLYRRILAHSHVNEQPFTRSGGPVKAAAATVVIVRAHMNTGGYGAALRGTPDGTFAPTSLTTDFASGVEQADPQPSGCPF